MTEGAYLIDRIRHKCREDGGCLIWTGTVATSGGTPRIYIKGKHHSLRQLLWEEANGPLKPGRRVGVTCKTPLCVEPEHFVARTRAQEMTGIRRSAATKAKISAAQRARSKFSPELIEMIRESDKPHTVLAKELGMNYQTVAKFRSRIEYANNPWAGL